MPLPGSGTASPGKRQRGRVNVALAPAFAAVVTLFLVAFVTGGGIERLHVAAGYGLAALVMGHAAQV